jgi:hypothetical protein
LAFAPISFEEYVKLHLECNPDENPVTLRRSPRLCISDALKGARCHCGERIWVVGSTLVGHACFICITGEAYPEDDYEIDEVLKGAPA